MLDLRSGGVKVRGIGFGGAYRSGRSRRWWRRGPGRKAEPTVTEAGESEGNPSHAELNLQDD